ncbi:hypothetical protein PCE1_004366 [Barthelona sp. PCE]
MSTNQPYTNIDTSENDEMRSGVTKNKVYAVEKLNKRNGFYLWGFLMVTLILCMFLPSYMDSVSLEWPNGTSATRALDRLVIACNHSHNYGSPAFYDVENGIISELNSIKTDIETNLDDSWNAQVEFDNSPIEVPVHWMKYFVTSYNITNVIFTLTPKHLTGNFSYVMVNAHYDSASFSHGAYDDYIHITAMFEAIYGLLEKDSTSFNKGFVFLFNGAEEQGLLAAQKFINTHPLVDRIKLCVNLEAAGVTGTKMAFFRSDPALIPLWAESGASRSTILTLMGASLMKAGIVSSNTDYVVISPKIPTLDFAFVRGRWGYHTVYDASDRISPDAILGSLHTIFSVFTHSATFDIPTNPTQTVMLQIPIVDVVIPINNIVIVSVIAVFVVIIQLQKKKGELDRWIGWRSLLSSLAYLLIVAALGFCFQMLMPGAFFGISIAPMAYTLLLSGIALLLTPAFELNSFVLVLYALALYSRILPEMIGILIVISLLQLIVFRALSEKSYQKLALIIVYPIVFVLIYIPSFELIADQIFTGLLLTKRVDMFYSVFLGISIMLAFFGIGPLLNRQKRMQKLSSILIIVVGLLMVIYIILIGPYYHANEKIDFSERNTVPYLSKHPFALPIGKALSHPDLEDNTFIVEIPGGFDYSAFSDWLSDKGYTVSECDVWVALRMMTWPTNQICVHKNETPARPAQESVISITKGNNNTIDIDIVGYESITYEFSFNVSYKGDQCDFKTCGKGLRIIDGGTPHHHSVTVQVEEFPVSIDYNVHYSNFVDPDVTQFIEDLPPVISIFGAAPFLPPTGTYGRIVLE